jgi:cytochrome b6-f complex iron-sulfur subunit
MATADSDTKTAAKKGESLPAAEPAPPGQAWGSPWPYDFPAAGSARTSADKVARATGTKPVKPLTFTRREAFGAVMAGWGAFAAAGGVGTLGLVRFLFPNTSFEPPQVFKTGPKGSFAPETVDNTWKSHGVWIVNTEGKILAISTVCTHLGCTPNWLAGDRKFKCPCHGSGYYINGVNFEGPTPRPLERFAISVDPTDGLIVVDKTRKCRVEQGTCDSAVFYLPA